MNKPLTAVVVGAGYFAQFHIDAWQRLPGVQLAGIVDADAQKRESLRTEFPDIELVGSIDQLTTKPDIVDIATPPHTHTQQIQQAFLNTDALVICQKPFCGSYAAAEKVVAEASQKQRTIVVHENFRFQPWYRKLKALLDDQLISEVQQVTFRLRTGDGQGADAYLDRQPYFQQMPQFLIHETGIHFIDVFRYLFGEPDAVSADLRQLNPHIRGEDAGYFTFVYNSGMRALFDGNRHLDHAATNTRHTLGEMSIEGTGGELTLDGTGNIKHRVFGSTDVTDISYQRNNEGFAADCVYLLQSHVVSHLQQGSALENSAEEYLQNQRIESLIYQANDDRCTLPIEHKPL